MQDGMMIEEKKKGLKALIMEMYKRMCEGEGKGGTDDGSLEAKVADAEGEVMDHEDSESPEMEAKEEGGAVDDFKDFVKGDMQKSRKLKPGKSSVMVAVSKKKAPVMPPNAGKKSKYG